MSSYSSAFDEALSKPLVTTTSPQKQSFYKEGGSTPSRNPPSIKSTMTGPPPESFLSTQTMDSTNPFDDTHSSTSNSNKNNIHSRIYQPPQLDDEESAFSDPTSNNTNTDSSQTQALLQDDGTSARQELEVALLQERHSETMQINQNMRQIRDINMDLASLVEQQQDMVDEVEENAEMVYASAKSGTRCVVSRSG